VPDTIGLYGSSQASYVMAVALARTRDVAFVVAWSCPMENSIWQGAYLVGNYVLCAAEILEGIPAIRDGLGWAGVAPEEDFTPADTTSESFLDPAKTVSALPIPVLALFAENDRQVDPAQGAAVLLQTVAEWLGRLRGVLQKPWPLCSLCESMHKVRGWAAVHPHVAGIQAHTHVVEFPSISSATG